MKFEGKFEGLSKDKEFISGWALIDSNTTNLWLHLTKNHKFKLMIESNFYRTDIAKMGKNPYCGFEIFFDSLPSEISNSRDFIYITYDKDGNLPLGKNLNKIEIPLIFFNSIDLIGKNQLEEIDNIPKTLRSSIKKLKSYAGYYRDWFYLKNYGMEPFNFKSEISAFLAAKTFSFNLNPFEEISDYSWISNLWKDPNTDIPKYKNPTKKSINQFHKKLFSNEFPITPEEITPEIRQLMIKSVNLKKPKLSVIMPNWNREVSVLRAIDSALNQTIEPLEIILCDDGSTDDSIENIKKRFPYAIKKGKLKIIMQSHQGVSQARNKAISIAKGDWFGYLDSDNSWHSDYLLITFYSLLIKKKKYNSSYSGLVLFGSRVRSKRLNIENFNIERLFLNNFIDLNCFVNHRSLFSLYGGFDTELDRFVDWDLIIRYTKQNKGKDILKINVSTVNYFRNNKAFKNISQSISKNESLLKILRKNNLLDA